MLAVPVERSSSQFSRRESKAELDSVGPNQAQFALAAGTYTLGLCRARNAQLSRLKYPTATVARLELELLISDRFQSERGLPAAIISCSFTGGRLICIVSSGRRFFGTGSIRTARPIAADS